MIIRSVLSQTEATNYLKELTDYMKLNGEDPEKIGKTFYECYWSKAQVQILFSLYETSYIKKSFSLNNDFCDINRYFLPG